MTVRAAAEATRIAAGDDRVRYDGVEIGLHWLTALLVVTLWVLANVWDYAPRGSAPRHFMQHLHISLGVVLTLVLAVRLAWRAGPGRRLPPADTGLVELAAKGVQYLLYALLLVQIGLGFCFRWAQGEPLSVFGLFTIPSPLALTKAQAHLLGGWHEWVGNTILIVAAGHAAAALYHHFWLHDDVLWRMLPGRRARQAEAAAPDPRLAGRR
jgi:cytochrome b561